MLHKIPLPKERRGVPYVHVIPPPKERREAPGARLSEPSPLLGFGSVAACEPLSSGDCYKWELVNAQAERAGELLGFQAGWASKVRAAGHQ